MEAGRNFVGRSRRRRRGGGSGTIHRHTHRTILRGGFRNAAEDPGARAVAPGGRREKSGSADVLAALPGWKNEIYSQRFRRKKDVLAAVGAAEWTSPDDWPRKKAAAEAEGLTVACGEVDAADLLPVARRRLTAKKIPPFVPYYLNPAGYEKAITLGRAGRSTSTRSRLPRGVRARGGLVARAYAAEAERTDSVFLVVDDGSVRGYAVARVFEDEAQLMDVAAAEDGLGIGRALWAALAAAARSRGAAKLTLEVSSANSRALLFYKRTGAVVVGRRAKFYNDGSDGILMDFPLP